MKYYRMSEALYENFDNKYIMGQKLVNYDASYYENPKRYPCAGNVVENWNPETTLLCKDATQNVVPDLMLLPELWLFVSKRFVDVISPFVKDEIQYLPVKIEAVQPQMKNEQFFVANVIAVFDALVYDDRIYKNGFADFEEIDNFAVIEKLVKGHHIFKVDTKNRVTFENFVSEDVKNAIVNAGLKGFCFEEIKMI